MAGMKIKAGDTVQVITARTRAGAVRVLEALPGRGPGHRRGPQRREEALAAAARAGLARRADDARRRDRPRGSRSRSRTSCSCAPSCDKPTRVGAGMRSRTAPRSACARSAAARSRTSLMANAEDAAAPEDALRRGDPPAPAGAARDDDAHAGPARQKVTLNMGVGEAKTDRKALEHAAAQLGLIAGQQPVVTRAKKSIAGFKIREGMRDRDEGHAPRRLHVRVPRPADDHRAAADPRLPRDQPELVRRPGQLLPRRPGADHLPGDRLRRYRPGARARRDHHDVRATPTTRHASSCGSSACRSGRAEEWRRNR